MPRMRWPGMVALAAAVAVAAVGLGDGLRSAYAQGQEVRAHLLPPSPLAQPVPFTQPLPEEVDKPLPINLPTALQLAGAQPLDIALAAQRINFAAAQLERAQVLWLPTLYLGGDYFRHDG